MAGISQDSQGGSLRLSNQSTGDLPAAMNALTKQSIVLSGDDDMNSFPVYGREVDIQTCEVLESVEGSNKVKINPVVSYDWVVKHYTGQQVAMDRQHQYVAYCLKGRSGGIVRLIHRELAIRALIKGYQGLVVDLSFAHAKSDILASLDENGTLYVHEIRLEANQAITELLLQLNWPGTEDLNKRVFWCRYLPEEKSGQTEDSDEEDEEETEKSMLLAVSIDSRAYVLNVTQLVQEHGVGPLIYNDVKSSMVEIVSHQQKIVDAAFSPDGSAIATASEDGKACFFNVDLAYARPTSPRCLYEWSPHNGKPLSLLTFLDNHKNPEPDSQFWKYAVTGADNNTELKVWTCENWQCQQTIRFNSPPDATDPPCLIAATDLSSQYLIMSDINHRVMYVLKLYQDRNVTAAHVCSISEFVLGAPCLSFSVMNVKIKKQRLQVEDDEDEEMSNSLTENKPMTCVHLQAVQPKHLQDMQITYASVSSVMQTSNAGSTQSSDVTIPRDGLTDVSMMDTPSSSFSAPPTTAPESALLLTPDAFTSSPKKPHDLASPHESGHSTLTQVTHIPDNTSMATVGGGAFGAGTESTVSSLTLTPKSSINAENSQPGSLTPTSMPLPPVTPGEQEPPAMNMTPGNEETARQLEELFGSIVGSGEASAGSPMLPADFITEQDILGGTEESIATEDSNAYDQKIWPKAPAPPQIAQREAPTDTDESDTEESETGAVTSEEASSSEEELNVKDIEQDVHSDTDDTAPPVAPVGPQPDFMRNKFGQETSILEEIRSTVLTLSQLVTQQTQDIEALKIRSSSDVDMNKLLKQVQQSNASLSTRIENSLSAIRKEQKTSQERLLTQTSQKISADLKLNIERTVSSEIKRTVLPNLQQLIDPVKKDLHSIMAEKLTAADVTFKDSISRLVNSQQTVEKIGHTVGLAVQNVMAAAHRDTLQQVLLPSFDASSRAMFQQISQTFMHGTNNYLKQVEDHAGKLQAKQLNVQDVITSNCEIAVKSLEKSSADLTAQMTSAIQEQITLQVKQAVNGIKNELVTELRSAVSKEISSALADQEAKITDQLSVLRSSAATPSFDSQPTGTDVVKAQIGQCLALKDYDDAFQRALTASDLNIVVYLLKSIRDPSDVFSDPCPLKQSTLLSLIQQLSFGLSGTEVALKLRYLADSVLNLDPNDSITSQHMVPVLNIVQEKLAEYSAKNPKSSDRQMIATIEMSIKTIVRFARRRV